MPGITWYVSYSAFQKAFGAEYAEKTSRRDDPIIDSASIMHSGDDLRIQHYVTFWKALYETTSTKAAVPTPKFGHKDWKFAE